MRMTALQISSLFSARLRSKGQSHTETCISAQHKLMVQRADILMMRQTVMGTTATCYGNRRATVLPTWFLHPCQCSCNYTQTCVTPLQDMRNAPHSKGKLSKCLHIVSPQDAVNQMATVGTGISAVWCALKVCLCHNCLIQYVHS